MGEFERSLEADRAGREKELKQAADSAAKGRANIDEFVATMRSHGIPPQTIYQSQSKTQEWDEGWLNKYTVRSSTVTYFVIGQGWMLHDHSDGIGSFGPFIIPNVGIADVSRGSVPEAGRVVHRKSMPDGFYDSKGVRITPRHPVQIIEETSVPPGIADQVQRYADGSSFIWHASTAPDNSDDAFRNWGTTWGLQWLIDRTREVLR